jgi:outer membrane protein TolC
VGGSFSLPVPNRTARGNAQVAQLEVARQLVALKQLEQTIYVEVDNAAGQVATTRKLIDSTRASRVYAERTLEAAQARLAAGTATTFEVLQFQRDLATAESNEVRALTDYQKALAAYARLTGTTLARNRIKLE